MKTIYIPFNNKIDESDIYIDINDLSRILKKYKNDANKIEFIAEMIEE